LFHKFDPSRKQYIERSDQMSKNKYKEKNISKPIENHETASWANRENLKPISQVPIPNPVEIKNAKEWVDTNEK
jgi:hypothetical protein